MKSAGRGQNRRNHSFVKAQQAQDDLTHCFSNRSTSAAIAVTGRLNAWRFKFNTIHHSGGNCHSRNRICSRTRRRIRFRATDFPVARVTVNPNRGPSADRLFQQNARKLAADTRLPSSYTFRNSVRFSSRFFFENRSRRAGSRVDYFAERTARSSLTVSFFRPAARRRARTFCPFFVSIRERNPCVFARFRLFG